jgi:hypothetical protein
MLVGESAWIVVVQRRFLSDGFRIHVCDIPEKFESLKKDYAGGMQPSHPFGCKC